MNDVDGSGVRSDDPSVPRWRRWLTPGRNRWIALAALVAAVLVGLQVVMPSVPREFELTVSMREWRDPPDQARRVSVTFSRGGDVVRTVSAIFGATPPREFRRTLSLPVGSYDALVRVETPTRAAERASTVEVRPGELASVAAPAR